MRAGKRRKRARARPTIGRVSPTRRSRTHRPPAKERRAGVKEPNREPRRRGLGRRIDPVLARAWRQASGLVAPALAFVAPRLESARGRHTMRPMRTRRNKRELAAWGGLAFAGGFVP